MAEPEVLLEIKDLDVWFKTYRGLARVLNGVSLYVRRGERVGVVGETGCGKTTTLRAIMKVLPREAIVPRGQILFNGRDVLKMSARELMQFRRQGASMVFQDPTAALNPVFTVGEQMVDVIRYSGGSRVGLKPLREKAMVALRDVVLPDPPRMMQNYPFQLSGGMRQRVCIAMALGAGRELLLADEPGTSLDVTIQDQILRLIAGLVEEKGLAVILVSHSLGVVREMTDRTYVMYAGNIVEAALTRQLFANPRHPYTIALLGCVPKLSGEGISQGIPGGMPDYVEPPYGCRFHPRCPQAVGECSSEKPVLHEVEPGHYVACLLQ